jgi:hypothetical protein
MAANKLGIDRFTTLTFEINLWILSIAVIHLYIGFRMCEGLFQYLHVSMLDATLNLALHSLTAFLKEACQINGLVSS